MIFKRLAEKIESHRMEDLVFLKARQEVLLVFIAKYMKRVQISAYEYRIGVVWGSKRLWLAYFGKAWGREINKGQKVEVIGKLVEIDKKKTFLSFYLKIV
ncbi:hypothetical protein NEHOM01_0548 [Nematocida homosporus]|uniref:uncharacterized protein n=1 Tax=Nematocida homosporus TaxID=1912981 RepID=UPI00222022D7|nr:uncharacterized protein NEHOM01_0548 [Nematocida homosporus]KAI5184997.1 hypothetical protein NEHOM01_0548 [Nematocida homosporus]